MRFRSEWVRVHRAAASGGCRWLMTVPNAGVEHRLPTVLSVDPQAVDLYRGQEQALQCIALPGVQLKVRGVL